MPAGAELSDAQGAGLICHLLASVAFGRFRRFSKDSEALEASEVSGDGGISRDSRDARDETLESETIKEQVRKRESWR